MREFRYITISDDKKFIGFKDNSEYQYNRVIAVDKIIGLRWNASLDLHGALDMIDNESITLSSDVCNEIKKFLLG